MSPEARLSRRGLMLILSSPSGAGKTTISRRLLAADDGLWMSVSVTTRPMRPGEVAGEDYRFVKKGELDAMVRNGELLDHKIKADEAENLKRENHVLRESAIREHMKAKACEGLLI